jgi:hypothetical protein
MRGVLANAVARQVAARRCQRLPHDRVHRQLDVAEGLPPGLRIPARRRCQQLRGWLPPWLLPFASLTPDWARRPSASDGGSAEGEVEIGVEVDHRLGGRGDGRLCRRGESEDLPEGLRPQRAVERPESLDAFVERRLLRLRQVPQRANPPSVSTKDGCSCRPMPVEAHHRSSSSGTTRSPASLSATA